MATTLRFSKDYRRCLAVDKVLDDACIMDAAIDHIHQTASKSEPPFLGLNHLSDLTGWATLEAFDFAIVANQQHRSFFRQEALSRDVDLFKDFTDLVCNLDVACTDRDF